MPLARNWARKSVEVSTRTRWPCLFSSRIDTRLRRLRGSVGSQSPQSPSRCKPLRDGRTGPTTQTPIRRSRPQRTRTRRSRSCRQSSSGTSGLGTGRTMRRPGRPPPTQSIPRACGPAALRIVRMRNDDPSRERSPIPRRTAPATPAKLTSPSAASACSRRCRQAPASRRPSAGRPA